MNNAVIHGDAANIEVNVQRKPESITAVITNNGAPLPERAEKDKSKRGIYVLLSELEERLGAETNIDIGPGNQGAIVKIKFPALPLDRGEKIE
jgi:nitrate/nitrite-specific signal transduction histidine kinase